MILFWVGMLLTIVALAVIFFELLKRRQGEVIKHKAEEYVNDAMQAERARAGTVIDKMAPPEVAEALDKLGRPGDP